MATLTDLRLALEHLRQLPAPLWPDFQPSRIAVVAWDGAQTTLFQADAAPSDGWTASGDAWTWPGRHPELVADTAITLEGGLEAAALMLEELDMTSAELAALVAHEAFHVYQGSHHQTSHGAGWPQRWQADELDVFGYPLTAEVLASRRLESLALRLALADSRHWRAHAAEALHWRAQRQAFLNAEQQALERGLERVEGLARFIELSITGQPSSFPQPDFAAEEIRLRCYSTGAAYAQLLDRSGDWNSVFMAGQKSLDELLAERLQGVQRAALGAEAVAEAHSGAAAEARRVLADREGAETVFLTRPGPRLVVRSGQPLWPQGFDPQNISELEDGRALHRRFLRFGNAQASGEVLGRAALTGAAGSHPLLHGFSTLTLTSLENVQHSREGGALHVQATGFELRVSGAFEFRPSAEAWTLDLL